jgi:uncharacterized Zn-binding protein involved in type VI secretion
MPDILESAARIDDPIEHTGAMTGAVLGAIAGFVVGALIFGLAGPFAIMAVLATMVFCSGGLELLSKKMEWFTPDPEGIAEGSLTVFVGGPDRRAARTFDKIRCHTGEFIVSGSATIEIEGRKAARVKDETRCDGKIERGCDTVKYGGPSVQVAPKRVSGELNPYFYWGREVVDWATFLFGGWRTLLDWRKLSRLQRILDVAGLVTGGADKILNYTGMYLGQTGRYDAARWLSENVTDTWWYRSIGWTTGVASLGREGHERFFTRPSATADVPLLLPAPEPRLALPAPEPRLALPPPSGGTPPDGG